MCKSDSMSSFEAVITPPIFVAHEMGAVMPTRADSPTGMYLYHFAQWLLEGAGFQLEDWDLGPEKEDTVKSFVEHFDGEELPKGLDLLTIETGHIQFVVGALESLLSPQRYETLRTRSELLFRQKGMETDTVIPASEIAMQMRNELVRILYPPQNP